MVSQSRSIGKLNERQFLAIQKTLKHLYMELEKADLAIEAAIKILQSPENGIS